MIISVDAAAGGTPTASNSLGTRMGEGGGEEAQNMEVLQGMGFSKAWVSFLDSYPCDSPRHSHNFPFPPQHSPLPFSAFALRKMLAAICTNRLFSALLPEQTASACIAERDAHSAGPPDLQCKPGLDHQGFPSPSKFPSNTQP